MNLTTFAIEFWEPALKYPQWLNTIDLSYYLYLYLFLRYSSQVLSTTR